MRNLGVAESTPSRRLGQWLMSRSLMIICAQSIEIIILATFRKVSKLLIIYKGSVVVRNLS